MQNPPISLYRQKLIFYDSYHVLYFESTTPKGALDGLIIKKSNSSTGQCGRVSRMNC